MGKKSLVLRVLATLAALGVIAAMCVAVGSAPLSRAENEDWREIARTRNSKVFQLYEQGEPGPYTRHEYSVGDMHYWDGESWQDPDFGATVNEGEVRFDKLPVGVTFSEGGATSYDYFAEDATLTIWPKAGNASASPEFADSTVRYSSLWPGVGLDLRPTGSGTKATLLLDQPGHPASFEFVLTSSLEVVQNGNRIELRDENGKVVLLIRPPFVVLDEINRRVGEVELNDNIVTLSLPDLTGLSYPLEVDPTIQVGASLDDAYDNKAAGGSFYDDDWIVVGMGKSNTGPSDPSYAYVGGFRFQSVSVAQGATIKAAKLQINHYNDKTNTVYLKVYGHDVDDSAAFSDATGENGRPSARTKTTAGVDWDPPSWYTNTWYDSPEIKTVVQEIVDRASWASGNDMTILVADDGSADKQNRVPKSYDNSSTYAAKLVITVNSPPDVPTSLLCEGQTNPTDVTDTTPEFSAIVADSDDGDIITHAEVEVGTTAGGNDMWDSVWQNIADFTEGNRSGDISYGGSTLAPDTTYYWRIRFKDDGGAEGAWSGNAQFTTQKAYYIDPSNRSVTQGNQYTFDVKGAHLSNFDTYKMVIGFDPAIATVDSIADGDWLQNAKDGGTDIDNTAGTVIFEKRGDEGSEASGSGTLATFTVTAQTTDTFTPGLLHIETNDNHASDFVRCPGTLSYDNSSCADSGDARYDDCDDKVDIDDVMRVAARWNNDCTGGTYPNCTGCDTDYDVDADYDGDCDITVVDIMKVTTEWGEVDKTFTLQVGDYYDDAYQEGHSGPVTATSNDIYIGTKSDGTEYFAGLIFRNVPIDYGSVISDARLILEVTTLPSTPVTVEIFSEDVVNQPKHGTNPAKNYNDGDSPAKRIIDKYPGPSGYCYATSDAIDDYCGLWVEWQIDSTGTVTSPNLALIVQEAIGRADYDDQDSISLLIRPKSTNQDGHYAMVRAYDYGDPDGEYAPVLEIEWVENTWSPPAGTEFGFAWGSTGDASGHYSIGTRWYSTAFNWGAAQSTEGGSFSWSSSDSWTTSVSNADLKILTHFDYWPTWAYNESGSNRGVIDDHAYDDYEELVKGAAARYDGDPQVDIDYWGFGNEPDTSASGRWAHPTDSFGLDCPNQLDHVYQQALTYLAIKQTDPSDAVFYGRIAHAVTGEWDHEFLDKVMDYGAGSFMDIMAYHYYQTYAGQGYPCDEYDSVVDTLDTTCTEPDSGPAQKTLKGVRDVIANDHGYNGNRARAYIITETGRQSFGNSDDDFATAWGTGYDKLDDQVKQVFEYFAQAAGEQIPLVFWHWFSDRNNSNEGGWQHADVAYGVKGWLDATATHASGDASDVYDDWADDSPPKAGPKPSYYAYWSFTHNLSDTITVSKMITDTDLPDGYEGYLFATDTITRAVVWNNNSNSDIYLTVSGTGSDYVRIARSTKIAEADASPVGTDGEGVGWAKCYDYGSNNGRCDDEDGTDIWTSSWYDRDSLNNGKFQIDHDDAKEPFMIWSDDNDIEITW